MVKAIRVHELGGPEVLKWEDVDIGEPKEGEIRVRNKAIGLNFIDVYFRKGVYKAATMPFTSGVEAAGVVTAVGPGVNDREIGDIVAYAGSPMGSYSEEQLLPADKVVPVPPSVDATVAASVLLKGLTAQYLVRHSYKVEPGHIVLVHAAAGGVGSLLCQWANSLGATVIGTVSTKEKAAQAKEDGCHHVIIYKEEDFVARVSEITGVNGVDVVYDSVGKDTFQGSLACLKPRGYMVSFGQSSGTPDAVPLSSLAAKSLFLTRPTLMHYNVTRDERLKAAQEVFAHVESGALRVRVNHTYPLSQAAQAHADLESRRTSGPSNRPLMFFLRTSFHFQCDRRLLPPSTFFPCNPTDFHRFTAPINRSFTTPRCHSKHGTENFIATAISSAPEMVKAIRVHELGGPEVLKWEDVDIGEPKEGEVRVRNKAIGLNFIDVYFRKGVYKVTLPFTPGMEAAGVVMGVGPGVNDRKVGDLVAYAGNPMGSYSEEQVLPADKVVPVPPSIDPTIAASVILKGMTAHFLLRRCYKVEPGHIVLVHAAAGGVGSLLCQWANSLGATVIGTISTKEKAAQAKEDGCHHVIIYKEEDFVARVNEITGGNGVNVVYDSVGKDTFEGSLACLKTRGYMVNFGQSSGTPDPVPLSALAAKSLFLTRPSLMQYTATRDELVEAAQEVFTNIVSGALRVRVNHTYPLSQAAQAHSDLEGRKTSGSVVLIP